MFRRESVRRKLELLIYNQKNVNFEQQIKPENQLWNI